MRGTWCFENSSEKFYFSGELGAGVDQIFAFGMLQ
jgi:hypothetical protein